MKLEIVVVVHLNLTAPDSAAVLPDEHGMMVMVMVYLMFLAHVKTSKQGGLDACFVRETIESACLCAPFIESFINVGEGSKVSYLYVSESWMK